MNLKEELTAARNRSSRIEAKLKSKKPVEPKLDFVWTILFLVAVNGNFVVSLPEQIINSMGTVNGIAKAYILVSDLCLFLSLTYLKIDLKIGLGFLVISSLITIFR